MLGKAKFKDFKVFSEWYIKNAYDWGDKRWTDTFYPLQKIEDIGTLYTKQFTTHFWFNSSEENKQKAKEEYCAATIKEIETIINYMNIYGASWDLRYISDNNEWSVIAFGNSKFIIPETDKWLIINQMKDYNDLSIAELKQLQGDSDKTSIIPKNAISNISVNKIEDNITDKQAEINELEQHIKDIKDAKTPELAKLQAEIDKQIAKLNAKKEEAISILIAKKEEMNAMIEQFETQLFVLESEIYGIRCFLGETTEFAQLTKGISEKEETPVVLFQKVRYLDEELGRMASIYNIEWKDHSLFEQLIANVPEALDTFCPNNKCVSIVKLSKSGRYFGEHDSYNNMLESYKLLHGNKIGILLRNGENVYIGWTDEDYINIKDDMFYKPETKVLDEGQRGGQSTKKEVASRYFIFSILQGLLENKRLITLPGKQNFMQPSPYIIYSVAENWLADNRYAPFEELIKKCNSSIKQGDTIITVQRLRPDLSTNRWQNNDRGRGYANRTHDVVALNCALYKINLIEEEVHKYAVFIHNDNTLFNYRKEIYDENDIPKARDKDYHFDKIETINTNHYFISLHKYCSAKDARANFEVYSDEFINLTFMNSTWLHNAIITKNLGGWIVGGQRVDYAYGIKYLKTALDFVKEREVSEKELIVQYYKMLDSVNDWQVRLSEWKLEHDVHKITDYQAKRFAKTL